MDVDAASLDTEAIRRVVDGVCGGGSWRLPDAELVDRLRDTETLIRRLQHGSLRLIGEIDQRGCAATMGGATTAGLVRDVLRVTPGDARGRVQAAGQLGAAQATTGAVIDPPCPATARLSRDGVIGSDHVGVIMHTLRLLPAHADAATRADAEAFLAEQAGIHDPSHLALIGRHLRASLDQDGTEPEEQRRSRNELSFGVDIDGMHRVRGRLTPEAAATVKAALDPLAAPRPATDGEPDHRPASQRLAEALVELCARALIAGDLPAHGGQRPQLCLTMPLDLLRRGAGAARADWGGPVPAGAARRLACDASIIPVVLGSAGEPLDIGRASHTVPVALRRALAVRDEGCAFPGCDRPPAWCDAHHIRHWIDLGPTAIENLVLLCAHHHATVHHRGWSVRIRGGRPEFVPPPWIDPVQLPRRNHVHDFPDLPRAG